MSDLMAKRHKYNEMARTNWNKKKEMEEGVIKRKQLLEISYVKLKKQIDAINSFHN